MHPIMAHRGWSSRAPENTMAAFALAFAEPRITSIEFDVQLSKDGVPVVIHDFHLDKTTNGHGEVEDRTLEELKQLDAGSWFSPAYAGERIPTLDEVLQAAKGKCGVNIEIKTAGGRYPGIEAKIIEAIERHGFREHALITSFDHEVIRSVRQLDASVRTGLIIFGKPTLLREQLRETGATTVIMGVNHLTPDYVGGWMAEGVQFIVGQGNVERDIVAIARLHPDVTIASDYPDRVIGTIERMSPTTNEMK